MRGATDQQLAAELLHRTGAPVKASAERLAGWSEQRLTRALGRIDHGRLLAAIAQVRAEQL